MCNTIVEHTIAMRLLYTNLGRRVYFGAMAAFGGTLVIVYLSTDLNPAALASEPHNEGDGALMA